MVKLFFDASIHFGQFSLQSEAIRIACKNSQIAISNKPQVDCVGLTTFNENGWVDHVIWDLERDEQDIFYPFMDVFHTVKNINRVPLLDEDVTLAKKIQTDTGLAIAHAWSCAAAARHKVTIYHTLYQELLTDKVLKYMQTNHGIAITRPPEDPEQNFTAGNLEQLYQNALVFLRKNNLDLASKEIAGKVN